MENSSNNEQKPAAQVNEEKDFVWFDDIALFTIDGTSDAPPIFHHHQCVCVCVISVL